MEGVVPLTDEQRDLVERHLYLTDVLTRSYYKHNNYEDLQQECRLKTCELAQRFDPTLGVSFKTFLYKELIHCIYRKILSYYNNEKQTRKPGEFQTLHFEEDEKLTDILEKLYQSNDICDDYVSKYITDVYIYEKLDQIFKRRKTSYTNREIMKEYLKLGMIHGFSKHAVGGYLAKKYGISRQRLHQITSTYMKELKEIWLKENLS